MKIPEIPPKPQEILQKLPIILQKNPEKPNFSDKFPTIKLEEGIKLLKEFTEKPQETWFQDGMSIKEATKSLANINQKIYEYYLFQQQVNLFGFLLKETLGARNLKN